MDLNLMKTSDENLDVNASDLEILYHDFETLKIRPRNEII